MLNVLPLVATLTLAGPPASEFVQVAPMSATGKLTRTCGQERAVVLIHGLLIGTLSADKVNSPTMHEWQKPNAALVQRLGKEADVFSFSYAQNVPLGDIVKMSGLAANVSELQKMGYTSIVLVGHSAGGLIARQFVEDNPDCGVAKVIQVCSPNGGATLADFKLAPAVQKAFLHSLSHEVRRKEMKDRADVHFPSKVEFVCVIGCSMGESDGLVSVKSQWTDDLQNQGIPAYLLRESHRHAVRAPAGVDLITRLVTTPQPRWDEDKVKMERKHILGK
jgi:hypothetical protein